MKEDKYSHILHEFVKEGNCVFYYDPAKSVDYLLIHGAYKEVRDSEGQTPFLCACVMNVVKVAEVLLQHGANPNALVEAEERPRLRNNRVSLCLKKVALKHSVYGKPTAC